MLPFDLTQIALFYPEQFQAYVEQLPPCPADLTCFSPAAALHMAEAAHLAYSYEADIRGALNRAGLELHSYLGTESTHAFVAAGPDYAVLSFRGTEPDDWDDVRTDGDFRFAPGQTGNVHKGFTDALDQIWSQLKPALEELVRLPVPLLFTGHSLGGALAQLAAARISPDCVYTFGSPKVGDHTFAGSLEAIPIHRIENCCDLVPNLPPNVLDYKHAGRQHFITDVGERWVDPQMTEVLTERSIAELAYTTELSLFHSDKLLNRWLVDHSIINYKIAIRHLLND